MKSEVGASDRAEPIARGSLKRNASGFWSGVRRGSKNRGVLKSCRVVEARGSFGFKASDTGGELVHASCLEAPTVGGQTRLASGWSVASGWSDWAGMIA